MVQDGGMPDEERQEVLKKIFEHLNPQDLNNMVQDLIEMFGEYECDDEPCETCGDYVETYTWEIQLSMAKIIAKIVIL